MRKHERRKIDAFELWCWRRVLRVSWMERKTNISIIESIKPEWTLESRVTKAALSYFGHVWWEHEGWKMACCSGGLMEREREEDRDKDGWTHSRGMREEPPSAT